LLRPVADRPPERRHHGVNEIGDVRCAVSVLWTGHDLTVPDRVVNVGVSMVSTSLSRNLPVRYGRWASARLGGSCENDGKQEHQQHQQATN
jgi:hypothetical protein